VARATTACWFCPPDIPADTLGSAPVPDCVQGGIGWTGVFDIAGSPRLSKRQSGHPFSDAASIVKPTLRVTW
jgi:hypothetical protein